LARIGHEKEAALRSLVEVITAPGRSMAKGRAWANLFLLGAEANTIMTLFKSVKLGKDDQHKLSQFVSRNP
jgi:hypothetical protein